ncbi:hypothetical protein D3C80_797530 [compost metagenome]
MSIGRCLAASVRCHRQQRLITALRPAAIDQAPLAGSVIRHCDDVQLPCYAVPESAGLLAEPYRVNRLQCLYLRAAIMKSPRVRILLIALLACVLPLAVSGAESEVTAIDILLEPDAPMLQHAQAVNDRLLKVFPKGFALDATHRPHITLVQRFVLTENLDKSMPPSAKSSPVRM